MSTEFTLRHLFKAGERNSVLNSLFERKQEVKYTDNVVVGSRDYPRNRDLFEIDFKTTKRILILGGAGSGKTWTTRAVMNRSYLAGMSPVILTDIKPEYYTSSEPLQRQFARHLPIGELPTSFPVSTYYPFFLQNITGSNFPQKGHKLFQLNMDSIIPEDILSFVGYEDFNATIRLEFEDIVIRAREKKVRNIQELLEYANKKGFVKERIYMALNNLKALGILGNAYPPPSYIDDINDNKIVDFNLFGWERTDFKKYVAVIMSIVIRELLVAKERELIPAKKHILQIFEELHAFAPKNPQTKAQEYLANNIVTSTNMGRSKKISNLYVTQNPLDIHPSIIDQVDYIFVPKTFPRDKLKVMIRNYIPNFSVFNPFEFGNQVSAMLKRLKWNEDVREWLVLEKGHKIIKVAMFPPLSHHKLEGEI